MRFSHASIAAGLLLAAGCSRQDFGRPLAGRIGDLVPGSPGGPAAEDPKRAAALRAERMARVRAAWESENLSAPRLYRIGADDVVSVSVVALEKPGETAVLERRVSRTGMIVLPLVGTVLAEGFTPEELARVIAVCYEDRFLKNPEVMVAVREFRGSPVLITGEVVRPGVLHLKHERDTLLEVLSESGGLTANAGGEAVIIRGANDPGETDTGRWAQEAEAAAQEAEGATASAAEEGVIRVDLNLLIDGGDLSQNLWIRRGDVVNVVSRRQGYVYVLGYVQQPGAFLIERDASVTAFQIVARAGGLTATARAENSLLIRETAEGPKVYPLDLTRTRAGQPQPILQAGDTLVVGSSTLARLSEFVRPSVGAAYSVAPGTP